MSHPFDKGSSAYYLRKADRAWEMAGLARQDNDRTDEKRWTDEARRLTALAGEAKREEKHQE